MTLDEIKAAVDAGKSVHWFNAGYIVHKDDLGQYLITFTPNGSTIGLTNKLGTNLNGREKDFFVAGPGGAVKKCCWTCGGTNIKYDAWAVWDEEQQMWELDPTFGYATCSDCDVETIVVDRPLFDNMNASTPPATTAEA